MSLLRLACCVLWTAVALAQSGRPVDDLVSFIRSAIQAKYDDKKIADEVAKIRLVNRLDDNTVQMVQHMGAGQKTMAALHRLAESSASLPAGKAAAKSAPAVAPPPS